MFSQNNKDSISTVYLDILGEIRVVKSKKLNVELNSHEGVKENDFFIERKNDTLFVSLKKKQKYNVEIIISDSIIKGYSNSYSKITIYTPYVNSININNCNKLNVLGALNNKSINITGNSLGRIIVNSEQNLNLKLKSIGCISILKISPKNDIQINSISIGKAIINSPINKLNIVSTSIGELKINTANFNFKSSQRIDGVKGQINKLNLINNFLLDYKKIKS